MQNLVIIGSGGHAESCLDVITSTKKFKVLGYIGEEINENLSNQTLIFTEYILNI